MTKQQTENDLEAVKSEAQTYKIANEEYRRVLRSKNSELATLKRESDQLTKIQQLKIRDLELG